jgi:hypothetical protein
VVDPAVPSSEEEPRPLLLLVEEGRFGGRAPVYERGIRELCQDGDESIL